MSNEHDANIALVKAAVHGWQVGQSFEQPAPRVHCFRRPSLLARVLRAVGF